MSARLQYVRTVSALYSKDCSAFKMTRNFISFQSQYIFLHQCIMDHLKPEEKLEENIYENADIIYANATALQEFHRQKANV